VRVRVGITRRSGLSDPEGVETQRALSDLGYTEVSDVHFGRIITLEVEASDPTDAVRRVEEMCARLLANPVIEVYTVEVVG